ncbi:hypothetical protein BKA93DRAFT_753616 [Sparassis latifolia]
MHQSLASLLMEDAASLYNYTNTRVTTALQDAFFSVFQILTDARPHPIIKELHDSLGQGRDKVSKTANFRLAHPIPILLGDASLIEPFLQHLHVQLQNPKTFENHELQNLDLNLFELVILCTYLDRLPANDLEIYHLLFDKTLKAQVLRHLTIPEQILAACEGAEDTTDRHFHWAPIVHPDMLKISEHLSLEYEKPLAVAIVMENQPYPWPMSQDPGLTGGPPYEMEHSGTQPTPRPRPRPRTRAQAKASGIDKASVTKTVLTD